MKFSWITRSLQISAVASALVLMLPAGAQTAVPDMPTGATAPAADAAPAKPRMHKRHHRTDRTDRDKTRHSTQRHHRYTQGQEPANASRLATSNQNYGPNDYERNAFARCEVFKVPEDRSACVKRLQQMPQGSVEGGGLLWEYSYEVPAGGS